jgi:hypothetical protein
MICLGGRRRESESSNYTSKKNGKWNGKTGQTSYNPPNCNLVEQIEVGRFSEKNFRRTWWCVRSFYGKPSDSLPKAIFVPESRMSVYAGFVGFREKD